MVGCVFGRLTVIAVSHRSESGPLFWFCRCECGNVKSINGGSLRRGITVSCGCRMLETAAERVRMNTTHGAAARGGTRTFHSWNHMKDRCYNPKNPAFKDYGGRGITVCERWRESFPNFLEDNGECPLGKSIDRYPNNNGNYEPGNVRWATPREQANNRRKRSVQNRNARKLECGGRLETIRDWAEITGIKAGTISYRMGHGWTICEALGMG